MHSGEVKEITITII